MRPHSISVSGRTPGEISPVPSVTHRPVAHEAPGAVADDGTHALLKAGCWITVAGLLALLATQKLFGGIGMDGPHTNAGWLSFMFALMGVPFGLMLLVLGSAKWLRNRHLRNRRVAGGRPRSSGQL